MDTEAVIVKDTQTLHSDMQTLVYENYNKFISATDSEDENRFQENGNRNEFAGREDDINCRIQR